MGNMERYISRTAEGLAYVARNLCLFESQMALRLHVVERFSEDAAKLLVDADVTNVFLSEMELDLSSLAIGVLPYALFKPAYITGVLDRWSEKL
ncbi:hypothetical protein DPMN_056438 [Dreissena polymorpha]|uniref:Uncharacterized protein n=1 Tax=Dreissena polymorpha TaxID=45954 RepID=A0A9D4HTL7_DREPO|nr:hypothetical protein DPMN_056438 [Dreissena polymorpha]